MSCSAMIVGGSQLVWDQPQAILHSLAHIESWAVDLSWDIIARFGQDPAYRLPREFFDDFVKVAEEEAKHFSMLARRLKDCGSHYGAFTAHDGLWETAVSTSGSLPARLAVEHCVHEARGLDVMPSVIQKFRNGKDTESVELLKETIYKEEVSHCAAGVRWIRYLHKCAHAERAGEADTSTDARSSSVNGSEVPPLGTRQASLPQSKAADSSGCEKNVAFLGVPAGVAQTGADRDQVTREGGAYAWMSEAQEHQSVESWFHELVKGHFKGALKPPFNTEARAQAGFDESWYLPLAEVKLKVASPR